MKKKTIYNSYMLAIVFLCLFMIPGIAQTTTGVSDTFEKIRNNEALLQYFFSKMPKGGDLHNHLTGSVYAETYFDIAVKDKMYLDTVTYRLYLSKEINCIQLKPEMPDLHDYRLRCIDHWSIRNFQTYQAALPPDEFFFATFGKFGKATDNYLVDFLKELRARAYAENVQYLEIMVTSPKVYSSLLTKYATENNQLIKLTAEKKESDFARVLSELYTKWEKDAELQQNIKSYVSLIDSLDKASNTTETTVATYYQTYASRNVKDPVSVFAQLYVGFKSCASTSINPSKLVGVNIVQAENGDYALRDYWGHMQMFKYLKMAVRYQTGSEIRTAMHAGELCLGLTPPEDLNGHIRDAVFTAGANRIGHGVDMAFEREAPYLLSKMAEKKVVVEINLTSNEFILGVKGSTHPIMLYHKNKVPIVLSTDDPGILRTNLTQQYVIATLRYPELSYDDFKQFVFNSIDYSFMPDTKKDEVKKYLIRRISEFESNIPVQVRSLMGEK